MEAKYRKNVFVLKNNDATVQNDLWHLRSKSTPIEKLRRIVENFTFLLLHEANRESELSTKEVKTANGIFMEKKFRCNNNHCFMPIIRAGIFMLPGGFKMFPNASADFIGIGRDHETLQPKRYLDPKGVKNTKNMIYDVLDPMVATGGSILDSIKSIKEKGVKEENIRVICIFTCPKGIREILSKHPGVKIFCVTIDKKLNKKGYIIIGLGDAGARLSGTLS